MTSKSFAFSVAILALGVGIVGFVQQKREGYHDTPILPGQKWRVNDADRPYPPEVAPALLGGPPSDALVLFDGTSMSHWCQLTNNDLAGQEVAPKWKIADGCIEVAGGTGNLYTKEKFGDCQLHVEWREPKDVQGTGQGRGNSGVFLQSRYEVQVLDNYRAPTYADGQAGAIYGQWPPLVNPQRPPGQWQAYDIIFEAAKFQDGKLVSPACETVIFNGVVVQNHMTLNGPTGHAQIINYDASDGTDERLYLQDHGGGRSIRFRNIWIRPLGTRQ